MIKDQSIVFEDQCVIDDSKVFYFNNKVYRAIYNSEKALVYTDLINSENFKTLIRLGLVDTIISNDLKIENCALILEHKKISFFLHPAEMTDKMFWEAALMLIRIAKELANHGLVLQDAHPWNITFDNNQPVFFDFGSIQKQSAYTNSWLNEFYSYFTVPVKLSKWKLVQLALEYRRQHKLGFGISVFNSRIIKKLFFALFFRVPKQFDNPAYFLTHLENWILKNEPAIERGSWDSYDQTHQGAFDKPETLKQKFVHSVLKEHHPDTVVDLATNKGYFALMAAHLGAKVVAFDYEPYCLDTARRESNGHNVTFCRMNFTYPTPAYGWGLIGPDAFNRFNSDIALALGLIHHVCLTQNYPVKLFCNTCAKFSAKGVLLEFVFPEDKHIKSWNIKIPADYNIDFICKTFKEYFRNMKMSELLLEDGIKRQFCFFYND